METFNHILYMPRLPTAVDLTQYWQTLLGRLNAELHRIIASILDARLPPPQSLDCSCIRPDHCRIVLATVIKDDGTTYLEPTFVNCDCGPVSHAHHQRQLDSINLDLKNKEQRVQQVMALEEGIRWLLVRHREFDKAEIRMGQYWLRQDYARTNIVRESENLKILRKNPNAASIPYDKIHDLNYKVGEGITPEYGDSQDDGEPKLFQIDKEDLNPDNETYEYNASSLDESIFKKASRTYSQKLLNDLERESSPSIVRERSPTSTVKESSPDDVRVPSPATTIREYSPNTVKEEPTTSAPSITITDPESLISNPTTPTKIHLGRLVTLREILSRFEDIKDKAASFMIEWDNEDTLRNKKFDSLHPQPCQGNCCCTAEHRLYHFFLNVAFRPPQQIYIDSLLQIEIRKSHIRRKIQTNATAKRQEEVDNLLEAFDAHIEAQIRDLGNAQGAEGRLKALVEYLRRYDGRVDLQAPEKMSKLSAALTSDLLRTVDTMLEDWVKDETRLGKKVDEMIMIESMK